MYKILGIDYGKSKVGLALADLETKIAVPLEVVKNDNLLSIINELIKSEDIEKIVVGLPLNMSGQESDQTREVKQFVEDLKLSFKIEVITEDERLSTVQAQKAGKRGEDDAVAAMYILQSYIDKQTNANSAN